MSPRRMDLAGFRAPAGHVPDPRGRRAGHSPGLFFISRHFERIADHAVNIAEDLLYMVEGRIVRHRATETA